MKIIYKQVKEEGLNREDITVIIDAPTVEMSLQELDDARNHLKSTNNN